MSIVGTNNLSAATELSNPPPIESVFIELTNHCNHHCTFCPSDSMVRTRGHMSPDLFRSICDQLARDNLASSIAFHLMGEPFINKHALDFLEYADKLDLRVVLTTNASLLDEQTTERVLRHLAGGLILSLQTPDAETFRQRGMKNRTFEQYRDHIRQIIRTYIRLNPARRGRTHIEVHFLNTLRSKPSVDIVSSETFAQETLADWWRFARATEAELGIDSGYGEMPVLWSVLRPEPDGYYLDIAPGVIVRFKGAGTFANSRIESNHVVVPTKTGFCRNPFYQLGVLWNGCCTLCCVDHEGEIFVGNAMHTPIKEIWFGQKSEAIRQGFREGQVVHPLCQRCLGSLVHRDVASGAT